MEWIDIFESSHDHNSIFSSHPPLLPVAADVSPPRLEAEWSFEENKVFEKSLADFGLGTPAFYENAMIRLPDKSFEDIQKNFESLRNDVEMIETNQVEMPTYNEHGNGKQPMVDDRDYEVVAPPPPPSPPHEQPPARMPRKTLSGNLRKRGIPWTEDEHQLFLMGLNKYGKGDWNSISRYYVVSKTSTQVASHAQKFYRRQNSTTPADRRRPSIHDIQTVNVNMGSGSGSGSGSGDGFSPGFGFGSQQMYYDNNNNGRQQIMMNSPMMNSYNYYNNNADEHGINGVNREMMMMMIGDPNYNYSNINVVGSTSNAAANNAHVDGSMMMRMMMNDPSYNNQFNVASGSNVAAGGGDGSMMMMNYPYGSSSCYNFPDSNNY